MTLLLLILDRGDVSSEHFDILGLVDLDVVLTARIDEEEDAAVGLLAQLNTLLVQQLCHLDLLVHVHEVGQALLPKGLNDLPGIIFWSCQLEQLHLLWSPNHVLF